MPVLAGYQEDEAAGFIGNAGSAEAGGSWMVVAITMCSDAMSQIRANHQSIE